MRRYAYQHVHLGQDREAEALMSALGQQGWRAVEFWSEDDGTWWAWVERASEDGGDRL